MTEPVPGSEQDLLLKKAREDAARIATEIAKETNGHLARRIDWDVRGIIALISITAAFVIAGLQLTFKGDANIPAWAATLVGGITGFYFGSRGGGPGSGRRYTDV